MRIAYLVSRFPKISETFVLYEILELQKRGFEIDADARCLFEGQDTSDSLCVYAQAHVVAQSSRDLVQYLVTALTQAGKLCLD